MGSVSAADIFCEAPSSAFCDHLPRCAAQSAQGNENLMPDIYDAVKSYATLGGICDAMRESFGTYEEVVIT